MTAANVAAAPMVTWAFWDVVWLTCAGGAFGGLSELLSSLKLNEGHIKLGDEALSKGQFFALSMVQLLLGICGAMGVVFIFSSTTWFPQNDTSQTELWILTLSVVAGFGSRRFLPIVTRRLESKINDLEEKVEKERRDVALNFEKDRIRAAVSRALAVLAPEAIPTHTEITTQLLALKEILRSHPTERSTVIVAGRLHRKMHDLFGAIALHSTFLTHKEERNERDGDYADVLYNRACYRCQAWKDEPRDELVTLGLADIRASIKHNSVNKGAVAEDTDFDPWREMPAFQELL